MDLIKILTAGQMKPENQNFKVGDTVRVQFKIIEGKTERIQAYEGLVISMRHSGASESFTVRKLSYGVGVERVFPRNSPRIEKVEIVRYGKVRRAKLYYIREKVGKKAKIKELLGGRKPMASKTVSA